MAKNDIKKWTDVINNMKTEVIRYYLKKDVEHKQPYRFLGSFVDFEDGDTIITFCKLRSDDEFSYYLKREKFLDTFIEVKEYY